MASGQRRSSGVIDDAETRVTTAPSIADQVHAILRAQIISGELTPNQRLTERGLSATLGVSATPVREAISQLEYERLLVRVDGRLYVAAPDARRLRELSLVQAALRGVAARLAAENASDAELAEIAAAYEVPAAASDPSKADEERLQEFRRRRQFHELIDEAAHNPTLSDMIATTTAFDFQLKSRALLHGAFPDPHPAIAEHREILDALLARDGARAEELMRLHSATGADRYLAYTNSEAGSAGPPDNPH